MIALHCLQSSRGNLQNMFKRCAIKYGCSAHVVEIIQKIKYSSVSGLQSATILKIKTPSRGVYCVKNAEIRAFSDPHFPAFGENQIRSFSCLDSFSNSVEIRENIWIREYQYFGIFYALLSCAQFFK